MTFSEGPWFVTRNYIYLRFMTIANAKLKNDAPILSSCVRLACCFITTKEIQEVKL